MLTELNKRVIQYGVFIISLLVIISGGSVLIYFVLTNKQAPKNLTIYLPNDTSNSTISDACHDFYQFACGEWENQNPLISQDASFNAFVEMEIMINHYFWKIIADESYDIEDSHLQNARKFYKSCVFTRNWKTAQLAYQSLIRDLFGGWELIPSISTDTKKMSLTDLFLPIISQTGSSLLFSINIKQDLFAVNISPGRIGLNPASIQTDMDKFEEDYYKLAFGIGVPHFEQSQLTIAFQMLVDLSNKISMTQGLHVSEFNEIISMKELKSICPQIDWSYLLKELLKQTGYTKSKQLSIIVEGRYQLKHRCELYGDVMKTKNDKSAFRTIIIMDFLITQLLQSMNLSPTGTDNNSYSSSQPHFDEQCINRLKDAFPWTLERHYIRSHVNETHKTEVINMFNEIKLTVIDSISKLNWLGETEKPFLQDKVSKLSIFALYSNQNASQQKENLSTVFQYPIREDNYYTNEFYIRRAKYIDTLKTQLHKYNPSPLELPIFTTRAYYNMNANRVYVNAGVLQPPLYYENGSLASKFGALGWIISHEIMHGIGIQGVLFDSAGTSLTGLTGLMLSSVIETKTSCIIDQYRLYEFTDYKTYRRLYEKYSNSVNQNYNLSLISDQLFFLSFAQSLCGHHSGTSLLIHSIVVPHVIERYRVFGALINSKEFAHAYGCPVGSPMNPDTKCDIW
ncbi:unnamed protein product [Schistosoma bovis]|nr:unnamed protein product [Schistosoma bovis]